MRATSRCISSPWPRPSSTNRSMLRPAVSLHFSMHVRQPEVAPLKAIRQTLVIDAQQVKNGGVQIVHVDRVLDDGRREVVCALVDEPALDPSSCEPNRERLGPMVAAQPVGPSSAVFAQTSTPEFPTPNHQRFVEQSAHV